MKTIFLVCCIIGISLSAVAQHDFSIKPLAQMDFNSAISKQDSAYLLFDGKTKQQDVATFFTPKKKENKDLAVRYYANNMPMAKAPVHSYNMPVAVPDSTVNFAIREKRIELITTPQLKK